MLEVVEIKHLSSKIRNKNWITTICTRFIVKLNVYKTSTKWKWCQYQDPINQNCDRIEICIWPWVRFTVELAFLLVTFFGTGFLLLRTKSFSWYGYASIEKWMSLLLMSISDFCNVIYCFKKKIKVKIWRANDRMLCDILKGTYMRLIYT